MNRQSIISRVLIVDDEEDIQDVFSMTLKTLGVETITSSSIKDAMQLLEKQTFDVCFTDMKLPDGDGLSLLQYVQQHCPKMPIAMITAFGNVELAVQALKLGAFDFVSKPIDINVLRNLVKQALALKVPDIEQTSELIEKKTSMFEHLKEKIAKLARSQAPVLITGESGTGKELVARLIHESGGRQANPFVPINCGAIPEQLMESEFFGHLKGSFTGAVADKQGLFKAADKGTLFLDEVADLPLAMQVKLLRAIQEKAIKPVGATKEIAVDVRILSATHKNLLKLVQENNFRQDLYYRINVIEVSLPSLRERIAELPDLIQAILQKQCAEQAIPVPSLSDDALQALLNYSFPGNVRELENILERALTLSEKNIITRDDLQLEKTAYLFQQNEPVSVSHINDNKPEKKYRDKERHDKKYHEKDNNLTGYLDGQERDQIIGALEKTRGNKTQAAVLLGISFRALRYRLKKLGLS